MNRQRVNFESTQFHPKNDYVLVRPDTLRNEEVRESGLIVKVETTVLNRPTSGVVLEVGEEITDIEKGQIVLWPETDGLDIEFLDGHHVLLRYRSVIGMIKK